MGLFWKNNGKKVRSDMKNILTDKRYTSKKNQVKGDSPSSSILADIINIFLSKK